LTDGLSGLQEAELLGTIRSLKQVRAREGKGMCLARRIPRDAVKMDSLRFASMTECLLWVDAVEKVAEDLVIEIEATEPRWSSTSSHNFLSERIP
jgi:hypothetical protein